MKYEPLRRRIMPAAIATALMAIVTSSAFASTTFIGISGSFDYNGSRWSLPSNWSGGLPNASTDFTYIDASSTSGSSNVILDTNYSGPENTGAQFDIKSGSLEISSVGVLQSGHVNIGSVAGVSASVTLKDPGASWTTADDMGVGNGGNGTLTLKAGAKLSVGNNGLYIAYGSGSSGTLNIGDYAGGTTGGTLAITGASGGVHFTSGAGTINFNQTDTFTLAAPIDGTGALVQRGTGTTVLARDNPNFSGSVTVSAGTLQIGVGSSTGSLPRDISNSGTVAFSGYNSLTYANTISGGGKVTKSSFGIVTFTGANTYTGTTTVNGGTLRLTGVIPHFDTGQLTFAATDSSGFNIASDAVAEFVTSTPIQQTTNILFTGTGTLRKSNAASLAWTTGAATFALGSGSVIDVQAGTFTGGSNANEVWTDNKSGLNVAGGAFFNGVEADVRVDALTGGGTITSGYSAAEPGSLTFGVDNGSGAFSGVLANGTNPGRFIKVGTGTQVLTGNNTYTGATSVNAGILQFAKKSSLYGGNASSWTAANLTVASGATAAFNVGGAGEFTSGDINLIKSLGTASAGFKNNSKIGFDTTNASGGIFTFGSAIANTNGGANAIGLVKLGVGTLSLTANNTCTGSTVITAGTLEVGNGGTSGSVAGSISISDNCNLTFNRSDDFPAYTGVISGGGTVIKAGAGTLNLTGINTFTGGTTVNAGTLRLGDGVNQAQLIGGVGSNGAAGYDGQNGETGGTAVTVNNASALDVMANATITGGKGGDGGYGSHFGGDGGNGGVGVRISGAGTLTNAGTIAGGSGGIGILTLQHAGANGLAGTGVEFSGGLGTLVNGGAGGGGKITGGVVMGNFANAVTLFSGSRIEGVLNIGTNPGASLTLDGAGTQLFSVAVTGTTTFDGALTKQGSGTWVINKDLNYTGGTTVARGTLQLGSSGTNLSDSGPVHVSNGTLALGASNETIGSLAVDSHGALSFDLSSAESYERLTINGGVALNGGTLRLVLTNGYVPSVGTTFQLLTWGGTRTGAFASLDLPAGITWDASDLYNSGTIKVANRPLVITTPGNITIPATSLDGELVTFSVSAVADRDANPAVIANPPSGSIFPVGTTTVIVTATDAYNNQSSASFRVRVAPETPFATEISTTGGAVPGAGSDPRIQAGAVWTTFATPAINDGGQTAYLGKWKAPAISGPVPAPAQSGVGIFIDHTLVVKVGEEVPEAGTNGLPANATFKSFLDPVMDGAGHVSFLAKIAGTGVSASNDTVMMSNAEGGALKVLAREGSEAPGTNGAKFKSFTNVSALGATTGGTLFTASLKAGSGSPKATSANDTGAWMLPAGETAVVKLLREGDVGFDVGETIKSFSVLNAVSGSPGHGRGQASGNSAIFRVAFSGGPIPRQAQVLAQGGTLTELAATGDTLGGPILPVVRWNTMSMPSSGNDGQSIAMLGTLTLDAGIVTSADAKGIFASDDGGAAWATLARLGRNAGGFNDGEIYSALLDPVHSSTDSSVAFRGTVKGGAARGGDNDALWWKPEGGDLTLLAREGAQPPGAPTGAKWKSFTSLALPGDGAGPIFTATLKPGAKLGGITAKNDMALYALDSQGTLREIMRENQPLENLTSRTVKTFTVLKAVSGTAGVTRAFNASHQIAAHVTFTDGTTAIVKIDVP